MLFKPFDIFKLILIVMPLLSINLLADELVPTVISKTKWGGHGVKDGVSSQYKKQDKIRYISIHHTDSRKKHPKYSERQLLRFVQEYHQNSKNRFRDIAYHYIIGDSGNIYKGRDDSYAPASFTYYLSEDELSKAKKLSDGSIDYKSIHRGKVPGATQGHITVCFLVGKPHDELLQKSAMIKASKLIASLLVKYDLKPKDVKGHREIAVSTKCPGDKIYTWLKGEGKKLIEQEYDRLK